MSQPPQDPQGYPWGPPEPSGASPLHSDPPPATGQQAEQAPYQAPPQGAYEAPPQAAYEPPQPGGDPYGGGQYGGQWTRQAEQRTPYPGQPAPYSGAPYGSSPQGYGQPAPHGHAPTSTIVLLVVGGLLLVLTFWTVVGLGFVAPVVLAIVALTRRHDPAGGRRLTRIGWIILAVVAVLVAVLIAVVVGLVASHQGTSGGLGGISALGSLTGVLA